MSTYAEDYAKSIEEPEAFWREQAQKIDWFQFPSSILDRIKATQVRGDGLVAVS